MSDEVWGVITWVSLVLAALAVIVGVVTLNWGVVLCSLALIGLLVTDRW